MEMFANEALPVNRYLFSRYAIIVEDDLELSPFWFTWLKKAWNKYGHREDLAGITLSVRKMLLLCSS